MGIVRPFQAALARLAGQHGSRHMGLWAVMVAALALRLLWLGSQPLWWDEGWSLYFARTNLGELLRLTAVDIHPPLYYLVLQLWTEVFGPGPISVRMLSVLIGVASIPVLYVIGNRLLGRRGGLLAAVLLAVSPFHVYYSQEVRMYGLVTLLGLLVFLFSLRLADDPQRAGPWLGCVLSAAAALYTQYYAGFLLLAVNLVFVVGSIRASRPLKDILLWASAQLASLAGFAPWIWYSGQKLTTYVRFKVGVEGDSPLGLFDYLGRHLAAFNWGHTEGALASWWWVGLFPLIVLSAGLAIRRWRRSWPVVSNEVAAKDRPTRVFSSHSSWLILIVILACGYAVNQVLPFAPPRLERLLLLGLPFYLLSLAAGLGALRPTRGLCLLPVAAFLLLSLLSLGFFYMTPRYPDDDYRPLASSIRAQALPTDAIVCIHPWQVGYFHAYLPLDSRPLLALTPREVLPRERQLWADDPTLMAVELDNLLAEHRRLWLPAHQTMGRILEDQVEAYLVEHASPAQIGWYGENTVLSLYAADEPEAQSVTAQFGEWLGLDAAALSPGPLEAGWGVVAVDLTWRLSERPGERYQIGLRLVDKAGRLWAQRDSTPTAGREHFFEWPLDQPRQDRHGLLIPAGTPPGDYSITLRVYRSHDGELLPVVFAGGSGGEVTLGTVRVARPRVPPPVEALSVAQVFHVDFDGLFRLLGLSLAAEEAVLPGETIEIDLFWQTLTDPGEDYLPRLQLVDDEGQVLAERQEKPVADTYPTAWWKNGDLIRDPHLLPVPATVPPGTYHVALTMVRSTDGSLLEVTGGENSVPLAEISVRGREHLYWPPIPAHPQRVRFGRPVELIGYELREAARAPGSPLEITLNWHVLGTPDRSYHVFVHLLDTTSDPIRIVAQHDGPPGNGELPALGWLPGEYLADTHLLQVPFDLPDGTYWLGVGLYDPVSQERLGDRLLLDIEVPVTSIGGCNCR